MLLGSYSLHPRKRHIPEQHLVKAGYIGLPMLLSERENEEKDARKPGRIGFKNEFHIAGYGLSHTFASYCGSIPSTNLIIENIRHERVGLASQMPAVPSPSARFPSLSL
ncbi:hypothetical protein CIHG_01639 [Coccidioides immitis H538.4]|uniref:Uncharacterized protein n=3 Tax=Coccidioides immitis TaxID=5501 RepID=A0A0J8RC67_COCIT|nr:hypothetical protein CIRG_01490 [Coccidioides immitis RMSCC 2394]KMU81493.1 hypothetical protein CISG_09163 [Coccidioides immitis RMSCC 3703]KMU83855.1 hypothetical protein CIHG_01639 [Coccidioides immitis H538.4]